MFGFANKCVCMSIRNLVDDKNLGLGCQYEFGVVKKKLGLSIQFVKWESDSKTNKGIELTWPAKKK